jgi:hypothetical protein
MSPGSISPAATELLDTLSPAQAESVTYALDDPTKTTGWSNLPEVVERNGIKLAETHTGAASRCPRHRRCR